MSGTVAVEEAYEGLLSLDDLTKGANNAYTSIKNAVQVVDKEGGSVRLLSSGAFDSTMIFAKRSAVTMNAEQTGIVPDRLCRHSSHALILTL